MNTYQDDINDEKILTLQAISSFREGTQYCEKLYDPTNQLTG